MADKIATREAYGEALAEFGGEYDLVVLDADLSKSTKTDIFKKRFPERFINVGIAEGNMMSTAAGLASCGKIVFASSFAMFAAGRAFEQIRNSIGYPKLNVKIGATHAGLTVGEDGATHQCLEDLGIMRTIPGMVVISPADAVEARAAVEAAIKHYGPVYLRFGRLAVPVLFEKDTYKFEIGKGVLLEDGKDVTIIANGLMVFEALEAKKILAKEGIDARVINIHTIKPIDTDIIIKAAKETGAIVTAEEHNIIGGLGSAVAEVLVENIPIPMKRVGVEDLYGKSGKPTALLELYGLTANNIAAKSREIIRLKKIQSI
ncbi:MAG: putative transketolase C-terminal section [Clostridiales bacterium]|jgi:transketolase|nr:putative transketolase C-terminal section [Clostridiales bacterium]